MARWGSWLWVSDIRKAGADGGAYVCVVKHETSDKVGVAKIQHTNHKTPAGILNHNNIDQEVAILGYVRDRIGHKDKRYIVDLLDHFTTDEGDQVLVTEQFQGSELYELLSGGRESLPKEQIIPLFKQIAAAVDLLHQHGIAHTDISVQNVLVDSTKWEIKLIDFGMATRDDDVQSKSLWPLNYVFGRSDYASPEAKPHATQKVVWSRQANDMHALGILLWEMCILGSCYFEKYPTWERVFYRGILSAVAEAFHADELSGSKVSYLHSEFGRKTVEYVASLYQFPGAVIDYVAIVEALAARLPEKRWNSSTLVQRLNDIQSSTK